MPSFYLFIEENCPCIDHDEYGYATGGGCGDCLGEGRRVCDSITVHTSWVTWLWRMLFMQDQGRSDLMGGVFADCGFAREILAGPDRDAPCPDCAFLGGEHHILCFS